MTRQRILITGASCGLGARMARAFAAKGRDLALCARRVDRLWVLREELPERYPGIIETNLVVGLVQIETALEMFKKAGDGHLVLISSVLGNKGVPGERETDRATVPRWPWAPLARLLRVIPPRWTKPFA